MITEDKANRVLSGISKDIAAFLSQEIREIILGIDNGISLIEEIRLRADKPLMIQNYQDDWFVSKDGRLTKDNVNLHIVRQEQIIKTLELMSSNSIYAYQDEIKNGFITLRGGYRVGVTGKAVLDGENIKNIKDISGLNIRISREVKGCAGKILGHVLKNSSDVYNTLIVSPPSCGKTTVLRDLARHISSGASKYDFRGIKVGIVDERSEIAACHRGVPQNDVGIRTDVLDGCPKASGMVIMLRSMSPKVIMTDEIGNQGDKDAVMRVINAGIKIITTAHGYNISELKSRQEVVSLINEKVFERYIVLSNHNGPGTLEEVIDGTTMQVVYKRNEINN